MLKISLQTAAGAAIGALIFFWWKRPVMAYVVWGIAGVLLVLGLFIPPAFAAVERAGKWLGKYVGIILTWGLLTPFYFLCFCPMRLIAKLRGKDPLERKYDASAKSYWTPRKPVGKDFYHRQF
ncbi:MAG: hypothetical protein FWG05_00915 [Kiritimatiellaeota bacterium]|nr:hypothetical protein [Kiritimatiellota bacterium]